MRRCGRLCVCVDVSFSCFCWYSPGAVSKKGTPPCLTGNRGAGKPTENPPFWRSCIFAIPSQMVRDVAKRCIALPPRTPWTMTACIQALQLLCPICLSPRLSWEILKQVSQKNETSFLKKHHPVQCSLNSIWAKWWMRCLANPTKGNAGVDQYSLRPPNKHE